MKLALCIFLKLAICLGILSALFFSTCQQMTTMHFANVHSPDSCPMHSLEIPTVNIKDMQTLALIGTQLLLVISIIWTFAQLISLPTIIRTIGRVRFRCFAERAWIWKHAFPFSSLSGRLPYFSAQRGT